MTQIMMPQMVGELAERRTGIHPDEQHSMHWLAGYAFNGAYNTN